MWNKNDLKSGWGGLNLHLLHTQHPSSRHASLQVTFASSTLCSSKASFYCQKASMSNVMLQFHESWVELTLIHRIAQIHQIGWCETLGSTPDHGLENIHRVANQFISQLLKIWQYKWKDSVLLCATALLFVIVLLFVKTHNVCGLTTHGPIGMQRRLCGRDTAQPMKNNTCKN